MKIQEFKDTVEKRAYEAAVERFTTFMPVAIGEFEFESAEKAEECFIAIYEHKNSKHQLQVVMYERGETIRVFLADLDELNLLHEWTLTDTNELTDLVIPPGI